MRLAERPEATVATLVEFFPSAGLNHGAVLQNIDQIGPPNGREPMRDHQNGEFAPQRLDRAEHARFIVVVEAVGRLVENQQCGTAQNRARERDPLTFPLREHRAALADDGVETLRQRLDELVGRRRA